MACIIFFMETLPITPLTTNKTLTPEKAQQAASDNSFFGTLIDVINPLQHIPVVSTFYREATGDTMSAGANILGGGLFGGVLGAASSLLNVAVEEGTGKDIGGNIMAGLTADGQPTGPVYSAPSTELKADDGQALVTIAYTGASPEIPKPEFYSLNTVPALSTYVNPALGLNDSNKAEQFKTDLSKTAIDMMS